MKLRYYSEFKSIKEKAYRLEIHTTLSTHSEPITLSPEPFIVECESSALYQPLKLSGATISLLTNSILSDLYTGENQGVQVRLYNQTDNVLEWFGYLTPNLYSSDYISSFDSVELEAIDTLSSLENIKYSYIGDNGMFRSFADVLFSVLDKADPKKVLSKVFIQKTNRMSKDSLLCLLNESYIHERNFFDEDNEPATCRDVIESLVQYYGMTAIQWRGDYYLIDYDFINRGFFEFFSYNRIDCTYSDIALTSEIRNVSEIGVAESSGSISLGDVYNKVSVVASMNVISSICPELFDESDLVNQNTDSNKYYVSPIEVEGEHHTLLSAYFKSKSNWLLKKTRNIVYKGDSDTTIVSQYDIDEVTSDNANNISRGAFFQKTDSYKNSDGEPSSINWDTYLTFVDKKFADIDSDNAMLELKNRDIILFNGGYFLLNLTYRMSKHILAHDVLSQGDVDYTNIKYHTQYGWKYSNTMIPCRLAVGDCYFDGERWIDYALYRNKVNRGYFESTGEYGFVPYDVTVYFYFDAYGYKKFVSESVYNSLPSGANKSYYIISKDDKEPRYYYSSGGKLVWVSKEYHYECKLRDRFWMVHINNENDQVFEQDKQLTNTVSYKMNLISSEDAQAIKLPDSVLTGELTFSVYAPNELSGIPQNDANQVCNAFHFTDLSLKYTNSKSTYDIFSSKSDDLDTVYSNVINDNNITEMDDITLNVNSYSKGVASYSNSATKIGDKFDYIKDIYNPANDARFVPEQILIDKLHRHYCTPKFRYQNCLNRGFDILSRIKENSLKKTMVVDCTNVNYANESCLVTLIEV